MGVPEATLRRWEDATGAPCPRPRLVDPAAHDPSARAVVWAAHIRASAASSLVRAAGAAAPLPKSLQHVKRVRKLPPEHVPPVRAWGPSPSHSLRRPPSGLTVGKRMRTTGAGRCGGGAHVTLVRRRKYP
jgi:hypothetical protein